MNISSLMALVDSLSKAEKRHFKLYAKGTRLSSYLELYDKITTLLRRKKNRKRQIDQLRKDFKEHGKRLDLAQNELFKSLSKSLVQYHSNASLSTTLKNKLAMVEVLHLKGLIDTAVRILNDIKKKAQANEMFIILLEVNYWYQKFYETGEAEYLLTELIEDRISLLDQLKNHTELDLLFREVFLCYEKYGLAISKADRERLQVFESHPLLQNPEAIISSRGKITFCDIKRLIHKMKRAFKEELHYSTQLIGHYEKNPAFRIEYAKEYTKQILDLQTAQRDSRLYEDVFLTQTRIERFQKESSIEDNISLSALIFFHTSINKIHVFRKTSRPHLALKLIPEVEIGIIKYELQIKYWYVLYFNIAAACFDSGAFRSALKWTLKILEGSEHSMRTDIYEFSRMLFVLIHFELGNHGLLEYELRSIYRLIKKKESPMKIELEVLNFIRDSTKEPDAPPPFVVLRANLLKLLEDPFEKTFLYYVNVMDWVDGKISPQSS